MLRPKLILIAAVFLIAISVGFLTACGAPTLAPPDGALPTCPPTCTGFCRANGQCTCDGMACQREGGEIPPPDASIIDALGSGSGSSSGSNTLRIATGTSGTPLLAFDFGNEEVGSASPALALTVINDTPSVSNVLIATLTGPNVDQFTIDAASDCLAGIELAPGASCGLRVRLSPGNPGTDLATLTIDAGIVVGRASLQVTGVGVAGPDLDTTPASFDFGPSDLGVEIQQTMRVDNSGGDVIVQSVAISNPIGTGFAIASTTCAGVLAAGASCDVVVAYTPTAFGQSSGALTIQTDRGPYAIGANWVMGAGAARLTVKVTGQGEVTSDGGGIPDLDCRSPRVGDCSGLFLGPDHVLTASSGALLDWGVPGCGKAATCAVTLSATPMIVQANFAP